MDKIRIPDSIDVAAAAMMYAIYVRPTTEQHFCIVLANAMHQFHVKRSAIAAPVRTDERKMTK